MRHLKVLLSIFCILLLLISCSSTDKKQEVDERKSDSHYQLGLAALRQGDYIKAKREFMTAIDANPDLPHYYNHLGLVFLIEHNDTKAEENFKKALKIDKKYSDARNNLGSLYLEQGKFDKALEEFEAVLSDTMYPYPDKAETNIGIVYRLQKNYDIAKQHFDAALKMRGTQCEAHMQIGLMYDEQNLHELAAESYSKTLEYCPFHTEVLYRAATKMFLLKKDETGRKYLRRCLEIEEQNIKEVSIPFLKECVDLAHQFDITLDNEKSAPEKKQQIESVN